MDGNVSIPNCFLNLTCCAVMCHMRDNVEQQSLSAHDITDNITWTLHAVVLHSIDFLIQKYAKVAGGNVSTRDTIVQTYYLYTSYLT